MNLKKLVGNDRLFLFHFSYNRVFSMVSVIFIKSGINT